MDTRTVERVTRWVRRRFDGYGTVTRAQLIECAEQDGLPEEVQNVLHALPQGVWTADEVEPLVRDILALQIAVPVQGVGSER